MTVPITLPLSKWKSFADRARPIAGLAAITSTVAHNVIAGNAQASTNALAEVLALIWLVSILVFLGSLLGRPASWGLGTVLRWMGGLLWVIAGLGSFFATLGLMGDHFGTVVSVILMIVLGPAVFSIAPFYMLWKDHDWTLILFYVQGLAGWLLFAVGSVLYERSNARHV